LKNQHEAKRLQPDPRLPLVIVRTIQHRIVQINLHFTATLCFEAKREAGFAKENNRSNTTPPGMPLVVAFSAPGARLVYFCAESFCNFDGVD
jgi:hypothetical protein